jgi:phosphohistidine phosphatase
MPTLMLLRHAKAKRPEGVDDFDRRLSKRGREAASQLGETMREAGLTPDLVLCSSSRRTRETWDLVAAKLGRKVPMREARTLYLAGPAKIMELVHKVADDIPRVLVVAHNPGIATLAVRLCGQELEFPTSALAVITFDVARWHDAERGTLARYIG